MIGKLKEIITKFLRELLGLGCTTERSRVNFVGERNTQDAEIQRMIEEAKHCELTDEGQCAFLEECFHYSGFSCPECPHLGVDDEEESIFKTMGKWLEKRDSILSDSDYKNHVHIVNHVEIESLLRGERPIEGGK